LGTGVLLSPLSAALLGLKGTTLNPIGRPSQLVTIGWFKITRNPMYLGLAIAYVGLCLILGRPWPLVFLIAPIALLDRMVIPFEEKQLETVFGEEFSTYRGRVRRWL
jgi:protein-S-isoprenylcysteine O-methyltransferase Ste14